MKRFEELIRSFVIHKTPRSTPEDFGREVAAHQQKAEAELPRLLEKSHLHLWKPGDPVAGRGRRCLIGVAVWSRYDMRLLDVLNEALASGRILNDRIDVFDFGSKCKTSEDLEHYLPGMDISRIFHTPVVGIWENGVLEDRASGAQARDLLIARYNLAVDLSPKATKQTAVKKGPKGHSLP